MVDPLITLEEAVGQLKISADEDEDDITLKMSLATAIVIDYIKRPDHGWDADTVPDVVKAAILEQLVELYRFRGDDPQAPAPADGYLSPSISRKLHRYRDPALA